MKNNEHRFGRMRDIKNSKARANRNTIYVRNKDSDWPLWISGLLYKDSGTLNITQSESLEGGPRGLSRNLCMALDLSV